MAHNLSDIRLISSYFQRFGISDFQRSGIYVFLIAFACVYYLINAPLLLSHWDLGWHLAAGDLIRNQADIPFHDPWSFTAGSRQWFNLSWFWDVIASVLFQYTNGLILFVVACAVLWVKADEGLRRFLVGKKGWREAYAGSYASIYVKP
jgi:hypothetical protein